MQVSLFRRLLLLAVLGGGATTAAHAQADPVKFGKVEASDIDDKNFAADSAAEAVVLCDYGHTRFDAGDGNFHIIFERVTRIKILKKSGYDRATVEVPLYHQGQKEEKIVGLKGCTYNLVNGQVMKEKLETAGMFREERSDNLTIRKFTLPNVRVGSVIEYAYAVNSDFLFNFQDWQFQETIPVRWSEYRASIPEYFDYKLLMQGYEPLAIQEHPQSTTQYTIHWSSSTDLYGNRESAGSATVTPTVTNHRWVMKDVPAFRSEPYMTTPRDYVARIDFELAGEKWPNQPYRSVVGSWTKINQELLESDSFGGQLKRGGFLKDEIAAITAKYPDPAARIAAVHHLVHQSVKYNNQDRVYSNNSLRKAYEQHSGNSADVNLLLIALLRDAGLQANPVILSTRDHGRVSTIYPILSKFNYVVAHVALPDDKEVLVDATEGLVPCGTLPTRCLNGTGRLIMANAAQSRWLDLTPATHYVNYRQVQLVLDEKGGYTGKVHQEHGGYSAVSQRARLVQSGEKKFMEELAKAHEGWDIASYAFKQRESLDQPLSLDYELVSTGAEQAVGTLYLSPLRHFSEDKNPFLHEDRRFPIDFGAPTDETNLITLTLPDGYEVEELPKPALVELPDNGGRFSYSVQPNQNTVQIMSRLSLRKAVYSAEEYAALRQFYSLLMAKQAERLVLKRKS